MLSFVETHPWVGQKKLFFWVGDWDSLPDEIPIKNS
jgi:hypothetical protein